MKLTINKLYGYKIYCKNKARYTNSYYLAKFEQIILQKITNKKMESQTNFKKRM